MQRGLNFGISGSTWPSFVNLNHHMLTKRQPNPAAFLSTSLLGSSKHKVDERFGLLATADVSGEEVPGRICHVDAGSWGISESET
jgi:hypothetical protein